MTSGSIDIKGPAATTGSPWITRFIGRGDLVEGEDLPAGRDGVELFDGSVILDSPQGLAELGHALVMRFDPPDFDVVEAAGLCGNGTDGTGPYNWPEVARAATTRPVVVFVAVAIAADREWVGVGRDEDEARESLLDRWSAHIASSGDDPNLLRRDGITVRQNLLSAGGR